MKLHWISPSFPSRGVKRNWRMFLSKTTMIVNPERQKLVGSEDDWHLPRHKVLSTRFLSPSCDGADAEVAKMFLHVSRRLIRHMSSIDLLPRWATMHVYLIWATSTTLSNYACTLDLNFTRKGAASRTFQGNRNRSRIYLGNSSYAGLIC